MVYPSHEKVAKVQVLFNLLILALVSLPLFCSKMAQEDTEQFSDDEIYQDIGDDFDLLDLNEEERAEAAAFVNNHDSDSDSDSGDELDDENLPLFYHRRPQFEWIGENYVPPAQNDNRPKYSRRSGPVRVVDASVTPLECFSLFYTEQIF